MALLHPTVQSCLNSRTTPAFQDTLGNGTQMLLLGPQTIRIEPNGVRQENAATNYLWYSQLIGYKDIGGNGWTNLSAGIAAPVLTQNTSDVMAPDGTQTATKIVLRCQSPAGAGYLRDVGQYVQRDTSLLRWGHQHLASYPVWDRTAEHLSRPGTPSHAT